MKTFMAYVRSILAKKAFVLNVSAEEPEAKTDGADKGDNPDPDNKDKDEPKKDDPKPSGSVNFEDLVSKARREERDKLYPEIEKQKERINNLNLVIGERDKEIAELKATNDKLTKQLDKAQADLKDGTNTNKTVSELTTTVTVLENELEKLQTQYESEINSLKLDSYKKELIASANGEIIAEMVTGNSEEEIQQSVEQARQRYSEIAQKAIQGVQLPRVNPSATQIQLKEKSMEEIAKMSPKEWMEYRKQLGVK